MHFRQLVADFAERTLSNLDYLQTQADEDVQGIYPVTQLWNSLLGLLVLPYERELDRIPETPLDELLARGWPDVEHQFDEPENLRAFIRRLRNAVAHFNVDFRSSPGGEIEGVTLRNYRLVPNKDQRRNQITWEAKFDLQALEDIARLVAQLYVQEFSAAA